MTGAKLCLCIFLKHDHVIKMEFTRYSLTKSEKFWARSKPLYFLNLLRKTAQLLQLLKLQSKCRYSSYCVRHSRGASHSMVHCSLWAGPFFFADGCHLTAKQTWSRENKFLTSNPLISAHQQDGVVYNNFKIKNKNNTSNRLQDYTKQIAQ